jgi:plasmid maintenance system antidote protein VapI
LRRKTRGGFKRRESFGIKWAGRNKLATLLGVTGPYLGRVLSGEKPMTAEMIGRLRVFLDRGSRFEKSIM